MEDSVAETTALVMGIVTQYGLSVIGAIIILVVGWIGSKWVASIVTKALRG